MCVCTREGKKTCRSINLFLLSTLNLLNLLAVLECGRNRLEGTSSYRKGSCRIICKRNNFYSLNRKLFMRFLGTNEKHLMFVLYRRLTK